MGRSPCCEKAGQKKGPWMPDEDQKLLAYIEKHGHGSWRALPAKAGLQRCGKSCRLRWTNYLRPDIKRGKFSLQEEQTIIQLHALLGNRWSAIATHLPKRTDNEIKNYWNTHLKKRLAKMGIDPVTHKPRADVLGSAAADGHSKSAANLSHMAQWESARLEAEARLARESRLRSSSSTAAAFQQTLLPSFSSSTPMVNLDVLRAWKEGRPGTDVESPTSTLTFSTMGFAENQNLNYQDQEMEWKCYDKLGSFSTMEFGGEESMWVQESSGGGFGIGFTGLLLDNSDDQTSRSDIAEDSSSGDGGAEEDADEDKYWSSILDMVNSSSPSDSPAVF